MKANQITSYPIRLYDDRNDVLYVYLDSQYNAFSDEEQPNIHVLRNDNDNKIVGFKILDFKNNRTKFEFNHPQYEKFCEEI